MATRPEKIFVAVGNDLLDGYKTLDWTLRKWNSHPISVIILHLALNSSKDFVHTPFGKLPSSAVNEEKLQILRKSEQDKTDNLLSKYMERCGLVKAEILKVEKNDEPIHRIMVNLVSEFRITKLVMGISIFMKSSSGKSSCSKSAISGCFHVQEQKAKFCELFVISEGKLVHLTDKKQRESSLLGSFLGKFFPENSSVFWGKHSSHRPSGDGDSKKSEWEIHEEEIEKYFQELLGSDLGAELLELEADPVNFKSATEDGRDSSMAAKEENEYMECKIDEPREAIHLKREVTEVDAERYGKAEWAKRLCKAKTNELEDQIKEELKNRTKVQKRLDKEREHLHELIRDVEESKKKLGALSELKTELAKKLQISSMSKANTEAQLERSATARADLVREIEELRRQRDVLQRRIDFCREKDAIGTLTRMNEQARCGCREYGSEDVRLATEDFSQRLRLKSGGDWGDVYKGRINHIRVAIKMLHVFDHLPRQDFQAKVKLLNDMRHPHLVAIMGFCSNPKCIIFEYMHNGSLGDILPAPQVNCKKRNKALRWHDRVRIAHEISLGLGFLHSAQPRPIAHGHLDPSNILLDHNMVSKISYLGLIHDNDQHDLRSDIHALGVLLWQLLVGRNWVSLIEDLAEMEMAVLALVLDEQAGKWPLDLAKELENIACRCIRHGANEDLQISNVIEQLGQLKKKADDLVAKGGSNVMTNRDGRRDCSSDVPGVFLCPILKEVMKSPHIAADGFSYELEAIEEWLSMGRDTSPVTNLRLKHKLLTPNHNLRNLIQEWDCTKF